MRRILPLGLLEVSDVLLRAAKGTPETDGPLIDALLRRAVSTAYYAIFHQVCYEIAKRLSDNMPQQGAGAMFEQSYRFLDHNSFKKVASRIATNNKHGDLTPSERHLIAFCTGVVELQEARHRSDYDPTYLLTYKEAADLTVKASMLWAYLAIPETGNPETFNARLVGELLAPPKQGRQGQ